ncbi:helix-turn-helix transcriptional regulator [Streptomyces sp. CB02414]|uniref:helix-turn-helix transcriptional regulator n=1 Tax=Streptomyces sp. CB02414 TaxID=1703922 RepID=UPI00093A509E|nr:LuxR family transcriptional regulator [Streptomyces sp. CB02414]OKI81332.1 hypothetical protein AMK11_25530 [Streptomyces sp. CB02414]
MSLGGGIRTGDQGSVREAEEHLLVRALDGLEHGVGRVIEVAGEPGTGKTHLLSLLAERAGSRALSVAHTRCVASELRPPPGQIFADVLREAAQQAQPRAVPTAERWAPQGWGGSDRTSARGAVRSLLRDHARTHDGFVLLLDDFHWADEESVGIVEELLRVPLDAPLLLVLAHRVHQASPRLRGALAHAVAFGHAERVALGPLTVGQAARLVGLPHDSDELRDLHRQSGGNPFRLRLAQAERRREPDGRAFENLPLPEPFAAALAGEIDTLPPGPLSVARAAAVIGTPFGIGAVARLTGLDRQSVCRAVAELCARDVLRPVERTPDFALRGQELLRQIRSTLPPVARASLHLSALELLADRDAPATEQAPHIEQALAEPSPRELTTLLRAARDDLGAVPGRAARWLRAALRVPVPYLSAPTRHELRRLLVLALGAADRAGGTAAHSDLLDGVLHLAPAEPGPDRTHAVVLCSLLRACQGHEEEARSLVEAELAVLSRSVPLLVQREILRLLGQRLPDPVQVELVVRIARDHGDRTEQAGALALLALVRALMAPPEQARLAADECAAVLDALSEAETGSFPEYPALLGWAEALLGLGARATGHLERAAAALAYAGRTALAPLVLQGLALAHLWSDVTATRRRAAEAARAVRDGGGAELPVLTALLNTCTAFLAGTGRPTTDAEDRSAHLEHGDRPRRATLPGLLALACDARHRGDATTAVSAVLTAGGGPELRKIPPVLRPVVYETLAALSSPTVTPSPAQWAALAERSCEGTGLPLARAFGTMARAHGLRGRPADAARLHQRASCLFASLGATWAQAWAMTHAAACVAADGRTPEALSLLSYAMELADSAGAARLHAGAFALRAELVGDGGGPGPLSMLTVREREVADIAGVGKKTREIARELSVSPRTVDAHLSRIYRKLNIHSRAALARLMAETG